MKFTFLILFLSIVVAAAIMVTNRSSIGNVIELNRGLISENQEPGDSQAENGAQDQQSESVNKKGSYKIIIDEDQIHLPAF